MNRSILLVSTFALMLMATGSSASNKIKILEGMPKDRSLSYREVVYVENDGRCQPGEIIKVTGGKHTEGIRRKYECIKRPDK